MKDLLKYLPILLRYGRYLKYVPFIPVLVELIRNAERKFKEAKSGAQKLAWASEQFHAIVDVLESAGLLSARVAKALRDGATSFITAIVEIMNATGGVDPGDGDGGGDTGDPTEGGRYATPFLFPIKSKEELLADNYSTKDIVYQNATTLQWLVMRRGQQQPAGYDRAFRLDQ